MTRRLRWGVRKLTDAVIREIVARTKSVPRGSRTSCYQQLAREFKCSATTVEHIAQGLVLPKGTLHEMPNDTG